MPMNPRLLRPRASGFDPRTIPGLRAWWDSADNSKIVTDTGVSSWADKSGNGYTITQGTGANQPTLSNINGRQAFAYNGSSQFLESTSAGLVALASGADRPPLTFFAVIVPSTTNATRHVAAFRSTSSTRPFYASMYVAASALWQGFYRPNNAANVGIVPNSTATYSASAAYVVSTAVGNSYVGRANGVNVINVSNTVANEQIDCNRFAVGASPAATVASFFSGQIGDVLIYNRVLSAAEIASVERWLARKFGVTLA